MENQIQVYDRAHSKEITEKVYGDSLIRLLYTKTIGQIFAKTLFVQPPLSKSMGLYYSSPLSRVLIPGFIKKFDIPMNDFVVPTGGFRSFNDFFIRQFQPNRRPFSKEPQHLCAPAEGRYLAIDQIHPDQIFKIKNVALNLKELIQDSNLAQKFSGGTCVIIRLCPVDYHRFHFHNTGEVLSYKRIPGLLHSVNPLALDYDSQILFKNFRDVTLLRSQFGGEALYVEVGAMGVGRIKQLPWIHQQVKRGEQKGWFEFGGSTVVLVLQKDRAKVSKDILDRSKVGLESLIRLGETFGELS